MRLDGVPAKAAKAPICAKRTKTEIHVAATALDQLVQDHARQKQELEAEIAARRAEWEQAQIAALEKQLTDAKQQVQDIAVKAIEGARALSHINQIAMEQAKNRPQG